MVEKNFTEFLGGVEFDPRGRILSAEAAILKFMGKMNATAAKIEGISIDNALGEYVREKIIDPLGRPTNTTGSDHYIHTCLT